jgi:hypothetical protein
MSTPQLASSLDQGVEHGFWYRVSSSAVLVGAGIGWTSAIIACCVAAPLAIAFGRDDERRSHRYDDL